MRNTERVDATLVSSALRGARLAIFTAAIVASHAHAGSAQASSGMREAEVRYAAALTSGDIETAVTFFDEAGVLTVGGCPQIRGRADVRSVLTRLVQAGMVVSLTPEDVRQNGDTAREVGAMRPTSTAGETPSHGGRYATEWVRRGNDWKIVLTAWMPGDAPNGTTTAQIPGGHSCILTEMP